LPSNPTRHTIARQWQLLRLLPDYPPGLSSTQLQQALAKVGHPTSKRTVERDLNELAGLFPLHCNSKGMPYGWYWQPGLSLGEAQLLQPNDLDRPQRVALSAWVNPALAQRLQQQPLSADMRLEYQEDGSAHLEATVEDNRPLLGWLLAHAGAIQLYAPAQLRTAMLAQLRQGLALHDGE